MAASRAGPPRQSRGPYWDQARGVSEATVVCPRGQGDKPQWSQGALWEGPAQLEASHPERVEEDTGQGAAQ